MSHFSVFDNLLEGVQVISEDLRYVYLNESVKVQGGIANRDVIGMKCQDVFPGIDQSNAFVLIRKCISSQKPLTELNKFEFPDGSFGYFELRINPIPEGVLVFSIDQTQAKRKEEMLKMSYERYETITAATNSALFEWDSEEKIIYSNSIFQTLCKKYTKKSCTNLSEILELGERKDNNNFRLRLKETIAKKGSNFSVYLEQDNNEIGLIAFQLNVIISYNKDLQPIGFIGYILDATENIRSLMIKEMNQGFIDLFLSDMPLEECLTDVLRMLISFPKVFRVGEFWLPNYDQTKIKRRACYSIIEDNKEPLFQSDKENLEFKFGEGLPGMAALQNDLIWWNSLDNNNLSERKKLIKDSGLNMGIAIPIHYNQKLVAVLTMFSEGHLQKRKDLIDLFSNISENIGHGIMSKHLAHHRDLLNGSDTIIILNTSREGKMIQMNSTAKKMFLPNNVPVEKFDLFSLLDPENNHEFLNHWSDLILGKRIAIEISVKIITKTGKRGSLKVHVTNYTDDDTIDIIGVDISKELELLELLSLFNDMASIGFWSIDLLNYESILSGNTRKILLINENEVFDVSNPNFLKRILPENVYFKTIEKLFNNANTIDLNWEQQLKNSKKQIRLIAKSEFKNGVCVRISGVVQDITFIVKTEKALELAENNYLDLFNQNPIPMWLYDPITLKYQLANRKACELYGYSKREFKKLTLLDIRDESNYTQELATTSKIMISGKDSYIGNFKHVKKNGETLLMDIFARSVEFQGKKQVLAMGVDRTESIHFQNEMTNAIIEAEEIQKEEISRELHDNVCQLLAAAQMYLTLHDEQASSDKKYWDLAIEILENANKETRELSHSLSTQIFKNQDLKESIGEIVNSFNDLHTLKIHFKYNVVFLDKELSGELKLNLIRVLQESLSNIQKHSKATEVEIVAISMGNEFKLVIKDNGIGFDPEKVKKGIGLYNIMKRVEILDGFVNIISSPGEGTQLELGIPLKE